MDKLNREDFLEIYRHSASHILAKAVMEIFGKDKVQIAIGPQIADGFYYDFELPRALTEDDFKSIEDKMREIMLRKEDWIKVIVTKEEALEMFKDQKFKVELINDLPSDKTITIYKTGDDFMDLCSGPHINNSAELLSIAYKIKSVSGAYWRGDENREQLQRIYVYAFPDKKQLKDHLNLIKEAKERDHKKIGPKLGLFMFHPSAPGMPYWLPNGWSLFNALLKYWRMVHERHGYQEISGPVLSNKVLWETSGHWGHYKENMFLVPEARENEDDPNAVSFEEEDMSKLYAMKPMNCPNAINVYKHELRSYKDLPIRISQTDVIHRREKSGELNGLFRVQQFRQDDAHILTTEDKIAEEIKDIMSICDELYSTFGLSYRVELSTMPEDHMGDLATWERAENDLRAILDKTYGEGNYEINEGDGAFYGPKIDLQMKDALGREWQMGTIQLDFLLPHSFDCKYTDSDGKYKEPVMIHRAIFGSFERFIGILTENFKGAFPFWLSPVQVGIVPIRESHNEYAKKVQDILMEHGIRVKADYSDSNMRDKIKHFKHALTPYVAVLGDKEAGEGTVSVNMRGGNKQIQNIPLEKFIEMCIKMNKEHALELIDEA